VHPVSGAPGEEAGEPQHHRRRVDPDHRSAELCRAACGGTWPASDVGHCVARSQIAESLGQASVTRSARHHAGSSEEPGRPSEARKVRVMIWDGRLRHRHDQTLTVELGFKSSGFVPELITIGEMASQAHIATSAIRYYERRGLLSADARTSGQRRYRTETLRRLVFIRMMQDIGLTLDEVDGILQSATTAEWKPIVGQRLAGLDEQIAQLQHARDVLAGVLLCPFDHPATDCKSMGAEIDRRLRMFRASQPATES
jgi:DNA-binding transcriptional MerR regulator